MLKTRKLVEYEKGLKKYLTRENFLQLLKAGIVLTVAISAPNSLRFFKPLLQKRDPWNDYYPSSIESGLRRLWRKGFVKIIESRQGYQVSITNKGKTEILKFDLNAMSILKQVPWDGKWRMVFFDIPAGEKVRNIFRKRLKELGFFQMQESVYVCPYPCAKEIQFLREVYAIPHEVKLAVVEKLENDADLRRNFHL